MNVVVCIKQVPDTEQPIRVRPDGSGIEEQGLNWILNYYDEHAVEEALRVRERHGGTVTVVCAGPPAPRRPCAPRSPWARRRRCT